MNIIEILKVLVLGIVEQHRPSDTCKPDYPVQAAGSFCKYV